MLVLEYSDFLIRDQGIFVRFIWWGHLFFKEKIPVKIAKKLMRFQSSETIPQASLWSLI